MQNSIGNGSFQFPNIRPWSTPAQKSPNEAPEPAQPFINPDIFRPSMPEAEPNFPGIPRFPEQPRWLPTVPDGPIIEVPNSFPMELPSPKGREGWGIPTSPQEMPDWSKTPWDLPNPRSPEVNIPKHFPNFPGGSSPDKATPPGTWLFSS